MGKSPVKTYRSLLLFIILYGTMFIDGFSENIKGVTYPLIKADFGISYEQQGMLVSSMSISYMLFCLIGGILLGYMGIKKTIVSGFMFLLLGLGTVFWTPSFLPAAASLFAISATFGLFEVGINALATQVFTSRVALLMNLLHFFYGVGSCVSPRVSGVLAAALGWRQVYLVTVFIALVVFLPLLLTRFPEPEPETGERAGVKKPGFFSALKIPMVWLFGVVLGLMVAVEICSANWAGLYFQDVYKLDPKTRGAAFVSNFFILFTLSRLLSGFIIEKAGYLRSLLVACLASFFIFILGFVFGAKGIYILPFLGFFVAIFWPTTLAEAMGYFRKDAPVMTGAIIVIAGALSSVIQFLIGLTNRLAGPAWGYRSCLLYVVFMIAALVYLIRCLKHPYSPDGRPS